MAPLVPVGTVRRAHGVRGAWAVQPVIDAPDVVFTSGAVLYAGDREGNAVLVDGAPQPLHLEDARPMNRDWLLRVAEVTDRDVADSWRGRQLLVEADRLPPPDEGELYLHQLIGMQVQVAGEAGVRGTVRDVYDAPQGYILEVETPTGRPLVPLVPELLASVDEATRTLVFVSLPGLLD